MRGRGGAVWWTILLTVGACSPGGAVPTPPATPTGPTASPTAPPASPSATTEPVSSPAADVLACMVANGPTVNDKSFAQRTWEGFGRAERELGVQVKYVTGRTPSDIEPNALSLISEGCDLVVMISFQAADVTGKVAAANPDQKIAIVDYAFADQAAVPNVRQLTFETDQAAFLAGYLAAGMSQSGRLGTYGGRKLPTVTIFMDGFAAGMAYYNEVKGTSVALLGWDPASQTGLFTGDFLNQDNGRRTTETLLQQGADIIMPVAGQVGLGTLAAVRAAGTGTVVWVDIDGCVSNPDFCDLFLTSVEKRLDAAVFDTIKSVTDGTFAGGVYVGTLENGGVGIAPYNEWAAKVPAELQAEVDDLGTRIAAGELTVGAP